MKIFAFLMISKKNDEKYNAEIIIDLFPEPHAAFSNTGRQQIFLRVNALIRNTVLLHHIDPIPNKHFLFELLTWSGFQKDAQSLHLSANQIS